MSLEKPTGQPFTQRLEGQIKADNPSRLEIYTKEFYLPLNGTDEWIAEAWESLIARGLGSPQDFQMMETNMRLELNDILYISQLLEQFILEFHFPYLLTSDMCSSNANKDNNIVTTSFDWTLAKNGR
ncbi:hypothetical protein TCAL_16499 [Tigriopus californicus]|uniref:Uncharacterized protein n=1 Tax=Tigriopus californicus TaxID=6832 RepID=A0A553NS66_TIGCA|nr:hypothetical protein TCAL_16499 [Tigriopus californicus]